ncbi:MAG TPA: FecR domain-containing protein [Chthoniobacterales bacterium]|nr:FecR domain-containing protein [Chthoniobacterales bacterium]
MFHSAIRSVILTGLIALILAGFVYAADKRDARVTQIVRDVRVLPSRAAVRPASLNETIKHGTAVRTGSDSRAELTFYDSSLTRLGANTVFSFDQGARELNLTSGAALICVPPEAGSVRISAPAVSAAISGGIAMAETHKDSWIKIIILEGQGIVTLKTTGKSVTLLPGQMIALPAGARQFTKIQNINLKKLTDKSLLIRFARLPNWAWILIQREIDRQHNAPVPPGGLKDPVGFDAISQRSATLPRSTPIPRHSPEEPPGRGPKR